MDRESTQAGVNTTRTPAGASPLAAVVLPGGGARAAYQVGVLKAISELVGDGVNPFPVICGTSAGAINAGVLASHAHEFGIGVQRLEHFWSSMYCERIYKTDGWSVLRAGARWLGTLLSRGRVRSPRALLDNTPLKNFLQNELKLAGIDIAIESGHLHGVAITASGYTRASAVSYYQGRADIEPWKRSRRSGVAAPLEVCHLMASAALPLIFPAERIGNEYFGDGGMRMVAPLSPAIHLGADRILVISNRDDNPDPPPTHPTDYPSLGEIGGYLLDTIFMDNLNADLARLERINRTLELVREDAVAHTRLKPVHSLVIRPSQDLRDLTQNHVGDIPRPVRRLLRTLGGWGRDWRMASYLLFEAPYCTELMQLGYQDGRDRAADIRAFFDRAPAPGAVRS